MEERPYQRMESKGKEKVCFHCMNGDTEAETCASPLLNTCIIHTSVVNATFLTFLFKFLKPRVPTRSVTCKLAYFCSVVDSRIFAGQLC